MNTINRKQDFFIIILISMFISSSLYSKPMPSPAPQKAIKSKWIVIAEYTGYKKDNSGEISYFQGPIANYKILKSLKGNIIEKNVNIRYDFQDGSACMALKGWEFTKGKMPSVKSKWILFLKNMNDKQIYSTYRGDYGRWKVTEENIKKIEKLLNIKI